MADFFDPEAKSIHRSVHTPEALAMGWIMMAAAQIDQVAAIPVYYRVVDEDGATIREANEAEKAVIDASRLSLLKKGRRRELANLLIEYLENKSAKDLTAATGFAAPKYMAMVADIEAAKTQAEVAAVTLSLD